MKKSFKILLWLVIAIILLLAIAGFVLTKVVNPNDYKGKIEQAVYQKTGRKLDITGTISWHFFPTLGIKIGPATLSNPVGYHQKTFASIQNASVSVHLWPLLSGHIVVGTVSLNGFKLNLVQGTNNNNWTFTQKSASIASPAHNQSHAVKSVTQTKQSTSSPLALTIHQINITNAKVTYQNKATHHQYVLNNFRFRGVDIGFNKAFPMTMSFDIQAQQPPTVIKIALQAQLKLDQELQHYDLQKMVMRSSVTMQRPKQKPLTLNNLLTGSAQFNAAQQTLAVQADLLINNILKVKGNIFAKQLSKTVPFSGVLSIAPFNINAFLTGIGNQPLKLPNSKALDNASAKITLQGNNNQIVLSKIVATLNQSKLTGHLSVKNFTSPTLQTQLAINTINVANYIDLKGAALPITDSILKATLHVNGLTAKQLPSTLNGNIAFNFQQAKLKGIDIDTALESVNKVVQGMFDPNSRGQGWTELQQQLPIHAKKINPNNGKVTDLGNFTLDLNIKQGIGKVNQGRLNNPNFQAQITGGFNLNKQTLNTLIWLYQTQPKTQSNGTQQHSAPEIKIPYRIQGHFNNLQYGVDWPLFQKQVGDYLAEALKQGLGQAIHKEAGKLLHNLFQ